MAIFKLLTCRIGNQKWQSLFLKVFRVAEAFVKLKSPKVSELHNENSPLIME